MKQHGREVTLVDDHIASRIWSRRMELGASQDDIARKIGVTYQQFQKYETGINRISAGRLHEIAQAMGVSVSYF